MVSDRGKSPCRRSPSPGWPGRPWNSEGQNGQLMDLRHDFVIRQIRDHDWPYAARVSGMAVSTLPDAFSPYPSAPPGAAPWRPGGQRGGNTSSGGSSSRRAAPWWDWPSGWAGSSRCSPEKFCPHMVSGRLGPQPPAACRTGKSPMGSRLSRLLGDALDDHRKDPAQTVSS